jgi:hypothetical protein
VAPVGALNQRFGEEKWLLNFVNGNRQPGGGKTQHRAEDNRDREKLDMFLTDERVWLSQQKYIWR